MQTQGSKTIPMTDILTPEDEILITAVITALAQQTEPLPELVITQLQQLGQIPPAELNDKIQDFLDDLDYQPLLKSVNEIEKQLIATRSAPPPESKPEHSSAIFNHFRFVAQAANPIQAAQTVQAKNGQPIAAQP